MDPTLTSSSSPGHSIALVSSASTNSVPKPLENGGSDATPTDIVITNNNNVHAPVINSTPQHSKIALSQLKKSASPVIEEYEFGESIKTRTMSLIDFKELGPVDLVHVSSVSNSNKVKETGQYHFINGLDVSSVDAPIAYMSSVLLNLEATSRKHDTLKIGTFCAWNCFSKGDLRIRGEFPGTISTTFIFADPEKVALSGDRITEDIWLETSVSSIIRSLLFNQDLTRILPGTVKLNPLQSKRLSLELIDKLCMLLTRGHLTGCQSTVLTPSLQKNYLNDAIVKFVELTQLADYTLLRIPDADIFRLLKIRILFALDREVDAVKLLYEGITINSRDAWLLVEQLNYLITKDRPDLALMALNKALNSLPTEFECWEIVIQVNIILGNYKLLLQTLNSSPMYSFKRKDTIGFNMRDDFTFDEPFDGCIEEIWNDDVELVYGYQTPLDILSIQELQACDPVLVKIFNNSRLQGTFAKSYKLISNMVRLIGWDKMLDIRSRIFVMEDEMLQEGDNVMIKDKTLCERWLDHLFLILYDDLRVVLIWENERIDSIVRHSALEWLLIGLLSIRCHHYESGILALKTTVNNKFNFFASLELIEIYKECQSSMFKHLHNKTIYNGGLITDKLLNDEFIMKLIVRHLSYEKRYYGEFNPDLILLISNFIKYKYNEIYLKSFIAGEFNKNLRLFMFTDRIIDWISMFIE